MIIETFVVTPFEQNCRLLVDPETKDGVIVDPGGDVAKVLQGVKKHGANVSAVWLTHSHLDHCGGVRKLFSLLAESGAKTPTLYGHSLEREMRQQVSVQSSLFGVEGMFENCPEPDVDLEEVRELSVGSKRFQVIFTPGHSPGHVVFFCVGEGERAIEFQSARSIRHEQTYAPVLLAGDTLFQGSIGRTDLPGGNHQQLLESIREKILTLAADTVVLSGHGPNTTLRREMAMNPFLI